MINKKAFFLLHCIKPTNIFSPQFLLKNQKKIESLHRTHNSLSLAHTFLPPKHVNNTKILTPHSHCRIVCKCVFSFVVFGNFLKCFVNISRTNWWKKGLKAFAYANCVTSEHFCCENVWRGCWWREEFLCLGFVKFFIFLVGFKKFAEGFK